MKKKKALITVELLDESTSESDKEIKRQMLDWFQEDGASVPWVKEVKDITIEDP